MVPVQVTMRKFQRAFKELVAQPVMDVLGGGQLIDVELVPGGALLDCYAGVDYWHMDSRRMFFGVAVRVQDARKNNKPTFTVRKTLSTGGATEYDKRMAQMHAGSALRPMWACHAYVDMESWELVRGAVAPQDDLIRLAVPLGHEFANPKDGNTFLAVPWSKLRECGVDVRRFDNQCDLFPGLV